MEKKAEGLEREIVCMKRFFIVSLIVILIASVVGLISYYMNTRLNSKVSVVGDKGHDWLMWRYDANRSAASPQKLSDELYLQWVREYPKVEQAWENPLNRDLMQFDKVYEPVVMGNIMFVGSSISDRMVALDTDTGEEKWSYYVSGPVRLPPVAHKGKVYFVSDDGYLYCLNAEDGKLKWKFRGGPSDRKMLGNQRLVSTWVARGGPVLKDGTIYFAAGIWPFMGIFIYALDAENGETVWSNDSTGPIYMLQPHNSPSYAGVAPQGSMVVAGDKLLIPCGRSMPACFDRNTGELLYYHLAKYNKTGGAFVASLGDYFVNYHRDYVTSLFHVPTGERLIFGFGKVPVMTEDALFSMGSSVVAYDFGNMKQVEQERLNVDKSAKEAKTIKEKRWVIDRLWEINVDASGDLIKADRNLYAGGRNVVSAIKLSRFGDKPKVVWQERINGTVGRLIAADNKLFAVTMEGDIYAFGSKRTEPRIYPYNPQKPELVENASEKAKSILKVAGVKDGYCLVYDLEDGEIVKALAQNSNLNIIAVDPDPDKIDKLRRQLDAVGLYGKKITVQVGDLSSFEIAPYAASLVVFENSGTWNYGEESIRKLYQSIRPYGGTACFAVTDGEIPDIKQQIEKIKLPKANVELAEGSGKFLLLTREGPLPGADDWTHQYGDIANTVKSDDQLVKLPLGLLWFGGSSNTDVLPRHGHGPPEQVIGGRLFIEGIDSFSARDVYTGRVLWKRTISDLDTYNVYYDETYADTPLDPAYNQVHLPGANARGTNFVATLDRLYIAKKNSCLVLDPATGNTIDEFQLPSDSKDGRIPEWGYIGVYKDYLIAGADFVQFLDFIEFDEIGDPGLSSSRKLFYDFDVTSSKRLVVMDRYTGKVIWIRNSDLGFRHNGIVAGDNRIFCIDTMPIPIHEALKRRPTRYSYPASKIMAFDVRNGNVVWNTDKDVFGTWLGYSEEYDILIQSGRKSRDMMVGEPDSGIIAYRGKDGKVLWSNDASQGGPYILHGDTIITERYAYSLLNGEQKMRIDPLTGLPQPWMFKRNYGCNYAIASEHLLTFRSAAAGFYDLMRDGGTGNFGGFKSSCTSNLIVADGVLNAPDYTRTCSCSYQNQASLALIHMPDVEIWTDYFEEETEDKVTPIKSMGINFGAPGDRKADNGTLWLEYPVVGGPSPQVSVNIEPAGKPSGYKTFYHHSSRIKTDGNPTVHPWILSSGVQGMSSISISLVNNGEADKSNIQERPYTVRLYFSEPGDVKAGGRVFNVGIQGEEVLKNFDIAKESGKQNHPLVKEFKSITAGENLVVNFTPSSNSKQGEPLICGIEIMAEF
jgi:hypothetical protein